MGDDLLALADQLWNGTASIEDHHPFAPTGDLVEVADGVAFVYSFANVNAFRAGGELLLVDTGSAFMAEATHSAVREWSTEPVAKAVYTHGHIDHVFGIQRFEQEAEEKGTPRIEVIAHEAVPPRFERYVLTAGYNSVINARQFGVAGLQWPTEYRFPDTVYRDSLEIKVGDERFELSHGRGETDDATWVWAPERKVLCCGDFFIWATPNAGNPQKVQRYPREWETALRAMAELGAEVLLPGHGLPVVGADRVRQTLLETADFLGSIVAQTLEMMNAGRPLDEIVEEVEPPSHLLERPYLQPIYDEPEFIVRNIWRLYGGWYDGRPEHLKPVARNRFAVEIAELCGGVGFLVERARSLSEAGDHRLACHLVELAGAAAPEDGSVAEAKKHVYEARLFAERSTMSTGVFRWAAEPPEES